MTLLLPLANKVGAVEEEWISYEIMINLINIKKMFMQLVNTWNYTG
jgi:hypothetical protein